MTAMNFSTQIGGKTIYMDSIDQWDEFLDSEFPIIIQAGANWCGPCQLLKPVLEKVAENFVGEVQYVYMDIDKFPQVAEMLQIQHIPKTIMIFQGDMVDSFGGVPQDSSTVEQFFSKAKGLKDGEAPSSEGAAKEETDAPSEIEGLKIERLNEGEGGLVPRGAKVKVHYTGKLTNGTVFDSSVTRGEPIEFVVGVGQVIKGWDEGITRLKKGQKAVLHCSPDFAYGARGVPGVIPPNSTLIFEVEVVDF